MFSARSIPEDFPKYFWERHITLGRVWNGQITYAQSKGSKDDMLATAFDDLKAGAVFLVAWTGRWSTDLFKVTEANLVEFRLTR